MTSKDFNRVLKQADRPASKPKQENKSAVSAMDNFLKVFDQFQKTANDPQWVAESLATIDDEELFGDVMMVDSVSIPNPIFYMDSDQDYRSNHINPFISSEIQGNEQSIEDINASENRKLCDRGPFAMPDILKPLEYAFSESHEAPHAAGQISFPDSFLLAGDEQRISRADSECSDLIIFDSESSTSVTVTPLLSASTLATDPEPANEFAHLRLLVPGLAAEQEIRKDMLPCSCQGGKREVRGLASSRWAGFEDTPTGVFTVDVQALVHDNPGCPDLARKTTTSTRSAVPAAKPQRPETSAPDFKRQPSKPARGLASSRWA